MDFRYYTLDVFTDKPFGGNPLAVFPDADRLPEAMMPVIARELNLSETVFVVRGRKEGALRRLRIFTPGMELPFAGHPTIGTAVLLAERGLVTFAGEYAGFSLEQEVGLVRVRVRRRIGLPGWAQLTAAQLPQLGPAVPSPANLARLLGLGSRRSGRRSGPGRGVVLRNAVRFCAGSGPGGAGPDPPEPDGVGASAQELLGPPRLCVLSRG